MCIFYVLLVCIESGIYFASLLRVNTTQQQLFLYNHKILRPSRELDFLFMIFPRRPFSGPEKPITTK
jgi:hypothetical protein